MHDKEEYRGFVIAQPYKPVSEKMWHLEIAATNDRLRSLLAAHIQRSGRFATPTGARSEAFRAARTYVDDTLDLRA